MLNIEDDNGKYAESLKQYHRRPVVPRKAIDNTTIKDESLVQWAKEEEKEQAHTSDEDMIPDPENEVQDGPAMKGLGQGIGKAASGIGTGIGSAAKGIGETVEGAGHVVAHLAASAVEDNSIVAAAKTGTSVGERIAEGKVY
jgi:hypothetical protein